jgi:phage gpG-like protein
MLEAKVNLGPLDRVLNTMRKPDLRPAWKEARKPLRADIREHRKQRTGPSGSWAPRASSTRIRAASGRRARPILGKLPTALTTLSDRRRVAMRSRVAWSDVHQKGGTVGHGARIAARPFLWASDKVLGVIAGIVTKTLAKIFAKGG